MINLRLSKSELERGTIEMGAGEGGKESLRENEVRTLIVTIALLPFIQLITGDRVMILHATSEATFEGGGSGWVSVLRGEGVV